MDNEGRRKAWQLYGWFTGLMMCGSCVGAVTWAAYMKVLVNLLTANNFFDTTISFFQRVFLFESVLRWQAAYSITYAIEFLCLSVAKLMVLDRMSDFAAGSTTRRWIFGGRVVMAAVVAGNLVGLAGNAAAAVYYVRAAELLATTASVCAAVNSSRAACQETLDSTFLPQRMALSIRSVQAFCEVAVLLLIVAAFVAVSAAGLRRISSIFAVFGPRIDAAGLAVAAGRRLRLRILGTTGFVFVTFLLRAMHSTMYAVAFKLQDTANVCSENQPLPGYGSGPCNTACYNVYTQMIVWMNLTPEYQLMIVLISKPFSLLVALWGMSAGRTRRHMQASQQDNTLAANAPFPTPSHSDPVLLLQQG
jgi:hypothetical protein